MNLSLAIMGLSFYILIWEKLPDWGNWFNEIIDHLPAPLAYLYDAWRCPFCFGFWIALFLHGLTGIQTIPSLSVVGSMYGGYGYLIEYFLDALTTASLIMFASLILKAIAAPAIKGHQMTEEFRQSMKDASQEAR